MLSTDDLIMKDELVEFRMLLDKSRGIKKMKRIQLKESLKEYTEESYSIYLSKNWRIF